MFQNSADVLPLLTPYGPVRSIKLVEMGPASSYGENNLNDQFAQAPTSTSHPLSDAPLGALVEYAHHADALMAKMALEGQLYGSISGPGLLTALMFPKSDQDQDSLITIDKLFSTLQSGEFGKNSWMSGNSTCSYYPEFGTSLT